MYDFVENVNNLKKYKRSFILRMDTWDNLVGYSNIIEWDSVVFRKNNANNVPLSPGMYCFSLSNKKIFLPNNSYIMYIGIVGWKDDSSRNLRERFHEYFIEQKSIKRPKTHYFLKQWKGNIMFHFTKIDNKQHDLKQIEQSFNDVLLPPVNEDDFSSTIRKEVKAAWN